MHRIPPELREQMAKDPMMGICMRKQLLADHFCEADPLTGKLIEWEHAIIFQGSQLQETWAIIPICYLVHRGGKLNKKINEWIALNRATDQELKNISRATDYLAYRQRLNGLYGNGKIATRSL